MLNLQKELTHELFYITNKTLRQYSFVKNPLCVWENLTYFAANDGQLLSSNEKLTYIFLYINPDITNNELQEQLKCSTAQIKRYIKRLKDNRLLSFKKSNSCRLVAPLVTEEASKQLAPEEHIFAEVELELLQLKFRKKLYVELTTEVKFPTLKILEQLLVDTKKRINYLLGVKKNLAALKTSDEVPVDLCAKKTRLRSLESTTKKQNQELPPSISQLKTGASS